jgi:hypothetical protein
VIQGFGQGPGGGGGVTINRVVTEITVEVDNEPVEVSLLTPEVDVSILTTQFILEGE